MLGEAGVPILTALFLKVNAFVLTFSILCLLAHKITGYIDLKVAMRTRRVTAFEPQVYSVPEIMPLTALLLLSILHWPQAQALFGFDSERSDFSLALKEAPTWDAPFAAFALLAIFPYMEELWRGFRAEARHKVTTPLADRP
jgi:hypothetical protein